MEEVTIKIKEEANQKYYIFVDGHYFRSCWGYKDLVQFMGLLIKSKFKKEFEGNF